MSYPPKDPFETDKFYIPEPNSGCWLWLGSVLNGYGCYGGKKKLAHRLSYEKYNNIRLESDQTICHKCDNTYCVNPDHLYLGTHQSNMDDMVRRERSLRGQQIGISKLTEDQARRIKYGGESPALLVKELNIGLTSVWYIRAGRNWRYI